MTLIRRKSHSYCGHFYDFLKLFFSKKWEHGQYIDQFEKKLSRSVGVEYAVCTSFGLHALAIILKYFKFDDQTELLIPGYTAKVVQQCLEELNIKYTLIDIDPKRATICPKDFLKKISPNTKGVLITHLLGNSCTDELINLAKKHNLIIIEDCAHAQGAHFNKTPLGGLGDASFFSFSYSKLINTYTGGALLTNNLQLYEFARKDIENRPSLKRRQLLRKFIMGHAENLIGIPFLTFLFTPLLRSNYLLKKIKNSINFFTRKKMTSFFKYTNTQAYLGLQQLNALPLTLEKKQQMAEVVMKNTSIQFLEKWTGDVYYNFIGIVPDAHDFHIACLKRGIDTGYGSTIMEALDKNNPMPGCSFANKHYLLLPNYDSLTEKQLEKISSVINEVYVEYLQKNPAEIS